MEVEENEQASVAGKIQKFARFWETDLDAPPFILDIEIFISKWLPQKKDVKDLELSILISWDGAIVDYLDLNFSNTFHDS